MKGKHETTQKQRKMVNIVLLKRVPWKFVFHVSCLSIMLFDMTHPLRAQLTTALLKKNICKTSVCPSFKEVTCVLKWLGVCFV